LKKISNYLILCYVLFFFGCTAAREYPVDLEGDIVPVNIDDRYKNMIEQQDGKVEPVEQPDTEQSDVKQTEEKGEKEQ
jgi:hypothetical protein